MDLKNWNRHVIEYRITMSECEVSDRGIKTWSMHENVAHLSQKKVKNSCVKQG